MENKQIKSKKRVVNHGEVLTPEWLVNDMLDLIPLNASKIDSRYLENSSGEGAFLIGILKKKLDIVFEVYDKPEEIEFYTIIGLSNIYGIELLKDNLEISKVRLSNLIQQYFDKYSITPKPKFLKIINHILNTNIINMNAVNFYVPLFNNHDLVKDKENKIIYEELGRISEWEIDYRNKQIQRIEYIYKDVVEEQQDRFNYEQSLLNEEPMQLSLFDFTGEQDLFVEESYIKKAIPVRIFEKVPFLDLVNANIIKDGGLSD